MVLGLRVAEGARLPHTAPQQIRKLNMTGPTRNLPRALVGAAVGAALGALVAGLVIVVWPNTQWVVLYEEVPIRVFVDQIPTYQPSLDPRADSSHPESTPVEPTTNPIGTWITLQDGVQVTVDKLTRLAPFVDYFGGDPKEKKKWYPVLVSFSVRNGSEATVDLTSAVVGVTYRPYGKSALGYRGDKADNGFEGWLPAGHTRAATYTFAVLQQSSLDQLIVDVTPKNGEYPSVYFEGAAK
jgi:hypothetical protein